MAIMNQAVPQDNVKEDLSTFLKKQPIITPALLVLYSMLTNFFKKHIIEGPISKVTVLQAARKLKCNK